MTRDQLNVGLATIITSLAETGGEAPAGHIYAALMAHYTLDDYNDIMSVLKRAGLVTEERHLVTITSAGRELAAKIEAARKDKSV